MGSRGADHHDHRHGLQARQHTDDGRGKTVNVTVSPRGAGITIQPMATMLSFIFTDTAIDGAVLQPLAKHVSLTAASTASRWTATRRPTTATSSQRRAKRAMQPVTSLDSTDAAALVAALEKSLTLAQTIVTRWRGRNQVHDDRRQAAVVIRPNARPHRTRCRPFAAGQDRVHFASDQNLGRILAAVGYGAPSDLDPSKVTVHLNDVLVARRGGRAATYRERTVRATMKNHDITVAIDLGRGSVANRLHLRLLV